MQTQNEPFLCTHTHTHSSKNKTIYLTKTKKSAAINWSGHSLLALIPEATFSNANWHSRQSIKTLPPAQHHTPIGSYLLLLSAWHRLPGPGPSGAESLQRTWTLASKIFDGSANLQTFLCPSERPPTPQNTILPPASSWSTSTAFRKRGWEE